MHTTLCLFLLLLTLSKILCDSINLSPSGQHVVGQNRPLQLLCSATSGTIQSIVWLVNDTAFDVDDYPVDGITLSILPRFGYLSFSRYPLSLNSSSFQCRATFLSGNTVLSQSCYLVIQGILSAVSDLSINALKEEYVFINWTAPYTLILSGPPPYITYCVDAWSSEQFISEYSRHIYSVCDIENSFFNLSLIENESRCNHYLFKVTPVNVVGNGTPSYAKNYESWNSTGQIGSMLLPSSVTLSTLSSKNEVYIEMRYSTRYFHCLLIMMDTEDGSMYVFNTTNGLNCSGQNNTTSIKILTYGLIIGRIYNTSVLVSNCVTFDISNFFVSTNIIQRITISQIRLNNSVQIKILYSEIQPPKSGLLIVLISQERNPRIYYFPHIRLNNSLYDKILLTSVSLGEYFSYFYDISTSGFILPKSQVSYYYAAINQGEVYYPSYDIGQGKCEYEVKNYTELVIRCKIPYSILIQELVTVGFSMIMHNIDYNQELQTAFVYGLNSVIVMKVNGTGTYLITIYLIKFSSITQQIIENSYESIFFSSKFTINSTCCDATTIGSQFVTSNDAYNTNEMSTWIYILAGAISSVLFCILGVLISEFLKRMKYLKMRQQSNIPHNQNSRLPIYEDILVPTEGPERDHPKAELIMLKENSAYGERHLSSNTNRPNRPPVYEDVTTEKNLNSTFNMEENKAYES